MKNKILKPVDLSKKLRAYENKWVALSLDYRKIFSSGKSLEEAIKKLQGKCEKEKVVFLKVLPFDMAYVPANV